MALEIYLNKFEKLAKRVKNRAACRARIEEWRVLFSRTAVFIHLLEIELKTISSITDAQIENKKSMFRDGDFNEEMDSFLESMPEGFNVKMTTLYDPHSQNPAGDDHGGGSSDVAVLEETANASKFMEASKKINIDMSTWQTFLSQKCKDDKLKVVGNVMHQRKQMEIGTGIVDKMMDGSCKIINVQDSESLKNYASLAAS